MASKNNNEFFYQILALLVSFILVHTIYVTVIRPNAESLIRHNVELAASGEQYQVPRSLFVVIKDMEQESCFVLMFWAIAIMGYKGRTVIRENRIQDMPLISLPEGSRILPQDANQLARPIQNLPETQQKLLLPRTLRTALSRFAVTGNVQSATDAVGETCETENERLDSELSMIRYIIWAIPSIGFIGTVRGIGDALGQASEAVQGNIAGVTASLGVAFNSTFVALLISMLVVFLMHQLQLTQERLVLNTRSYCENNLLQYLKSDS